MGGNRALLAAPELGRAIRLFRSESTATTYLGEFLLAEPPYYRADAADRNGEVRSVLVFRLVPEGAAVHDAGDAAPPDVQVPEVLPLEAANIEAYALSRPDEPPIAVRREAKLVAEYEQWLSISGNEAVRHRIPIPDGGYLYTDVFDVRTEELIEAKASAARVCIRAGLGQVLDYGRFIDHRSKALLVPTRPSVDLVELLHAYGVNVIWPTRGGFLRLDA
ncbi:MAG: hypothetical protein ABJB98_01415 [Actinomycetota bacterium]